MCSSFLFFSARYLPGQGGVERFTRNLARALQERGHRVTVATGALPGLPRQEVDGDGLEIFRFPSLELMQGRFPVMKLPAEDRVLWSRHYDGCLINTYFYPMSLYAARETKKRGIPALILNHGSAWLMTGSPLPVLAGRAYERLAVFLLRDRDFYGVSRAACDWMAVFGIRAKGIITNAVDPAALQAQADPATDWRHELGLPHGARILAFAGRMIPEKGVQPLIAAMKAIRQQVPGAVLLMAGGGPLLEVLPRQDGVYLLGPQSYGRVLALLAQADLFCLPSRSEGFACTVLEAAALNCPIVTTATGGSPDLLTSGEYGILLPSMEPQDIAAGCIRALCDDAWRRKAAALTKQRVLDHYTWDTAADQFLSAFSCR